MCCTYNYDGTWAGMLSVIFESFDRKEIPDRIQNINDTSNHFFEEKRLITTDMERAKRVANGIKKVSNKTYRRIYWTFLSEKENREIVGLKLAQLVFKNKYSAEADYGNSLVLRAKQIEKEINREIHRMHAFVRFQRGADEIYYAFIEPDFNVMPLIGSHFEKRYADQKWLIFDLRRNYGIYYDLIHTSFVNIDFVDNLNNGKLPTEAMHNEEKDYQVLWKSYFEHLNIKERKNMRLHLQHVPKRYWHLMTEKEQY